MNASRDETLRRRAVDVVRAAYGVADKMRKVDLEAINEPRPPTLPSLHYDIVRESSRELTGRLNVGHLV